MSISSNVVNTIAFPIFRFFINVICTFTLNRFYTIINIVRPTTLQSDKIIYTVVMTMPHSCNIAAMVKVIVVISNIALVSNINFFVVIFDDLVSFTWYFYDDGSWGTIRAILVCTINFPFMFTITKIRFIDETFHPRYLRFSKLFNINVIIFSNHFFKVFYNFINVIWFNTTDTDTIILGCITL